MYVALDATYLVDPHPSGIAVYSRELLNGLAQLHSGDRFLHLYRLKQYRRAARPAFPNVQSRLILPPFPAAVPWLKPDVFHALNQRVEQRLAPRVVSTFHDLFVLSGDYSSPEFRARFSRQAREAAARSDLIIAVSEFTKDQVVSYLHVDAARVRVIPHGVHPTPDPPPLASRERMILCVGALQVRKNVSRLTEAFERLPDIVRAGWKLVLVGSTDGFGAAEILTRINHSIVASQIQLPGYITTSELRDLYRRAQIFAFPSLDEGFGIPVLEAMSNGVPVLTSNRSALPQVVGDAAMLIDPYDTDGMTKALAELMENSNLRERLRISGLERAKLFSWSKATQATYAIYQELQR